MVATLESGPPEGSDVVGAPSLHIMSTIGFCFTGTADLLYLLSSVAVLRLLHGLPHARGPAGQGAVR